MGNAFHMDIPDSPRFRPISAKMVSPAQILIPAFPPGEDNNIPPGCILSVSPSRNSSAYIHQVCPARTFGCSFYAQDSCDPLSLPASVSPLLCISSIHLSSCAPARIQQYRMTATHTPAVAIIPFILLHPSLMGTSVIKPIYGGMEKALTESSP